MNQNPDQSSARRGSALVLAVAFAALIGATVTLATLHRGVSEPRPAAGVTLRAVEYLAETGVEDGRNRLFEQQRNLTASLRQAAGPNGVIEFDPDRVRPVFDRRGRLVGLEGFGDDVPLAIAPKGVGEYLAFLSNDPLDDDPLVDTNGRVVITGVAAGPGKSFDVVQSAVEPVPLMPSPPPCVLTLLGPDPDFSPSRAHFYRRDCGAGREDAGVPSICVGGFVDHDRSYLGPVDATSQAEAARRALDAIASRIGQASVVANLDEGAGSDWTDCERLLDLVERVRAAADFRCDGPRCAVDEPDGWSRDAAPALRPSSITFVDGDLDVRAGVRGQGLVLVTGRIDLDASAEWNGTILALGRGEIVREGGTLRGAAVAANVSGPDQVPGTADDCREGLLGFHSARYQERGEGIAEAAYCSENIAAANPVLRYTSR